MRETDRKGVYVVVVNVDVGVVDCRFVDPAEGFVADLLVEEDIGMELVDHIVATL